MANCIAWATGGDKGRARQVSRRGRQYAEGNAATHRTQAIATVYADGHGSVIVRDIHLGKIIHEFEFGPERER